MNACAFLFISMTDKFSNVTMDITEIRTIERVIAAMDLEVKLSFDIMTVIKSLRKLQVIDNSVLKRFRDDFKGSGDSNGKKLVQFNRFIWEMCCFISFEQLSAVLHDSGYQSVIDSLVSENKNTKYHTKISLNNIPDGETFQNRHTEIIAYNDSARYLHDFAIDSAIEDDCDEIPRPIARYRLPHAGHLNRFYIELKVRLDNNTLHRGLHNGTRNSLRLMISNLDTVLNSCENPRRRQLLLDKRVVLYFLLAQLYADFGERMHILKRLHDSMPYGVDRTMFKAIYHSNMAVSWAMKGNVKTALEHVAIAMEENFTCAPCLPVYVAMMGAHITHTEVYLCEKSEDYLRQALTDYELVSQLVKDASKEEQMVWKSGTLLVMASALLGIKFFSKVCDDNACPNAENLERARHILASVRQLKSLPKHRELMLYLCMGKLHDIDGNLVEAIKYIQKARDLADSCSSNITEKSNITLYLSRLQNLTGFSHFNRAKRPGELQRVMWYFTYNPFRSVEENEET